jgi:Ran GTPase-activating protein (RanGAP) involved in mRNA processing and transport
MENKTLRTLELGYNPIGPKGGASLANAVKFHSNISTLRMGWCKITKEGAWHIADAMKYNQCVTVLDLRGNELGDEGCAALAQSLSLVNEKLSSLDLGYNEIKDNGAFALAQAIKNNADGSIASISVNNNYITKFGEVALTEAVELVQELNPERDLYVQF